jgi:hypothetical protein
MLEKLEEYQTYKSYMSSPFKSIKHTTYFPVHDHLFERFRGKDRYAEDQMLLDSSMGNALYLIRKKFPILVRINFVKNAAKLILQVANIRKDLKISKYFK